MRDSEKCSISWIPTDDIYTFDFNNNEEVLFEYEGWIVCKSAMIAHRCQDGQFGKPTEIERGYTSKCKHCRVKLASETIDKLNKIYRLMRPPRSNIVSYTSR